MRIALNTALLALAPLSLVACQSAPGDAPEARLEGASSPPPLAQHAPGAGEDTELPKRRAMTQTERRAIAEARSRRNAHTTSPEVTPVAENDGSTLVGFRPTGLTHHEERAAMDDPAVRMPEGAPAPVASDAKRVAESPPSAPLDLKTSLPHRPGVELRGAIDGVKLVDLAIATEVKRREPLGIDDAFVVLPKMFHCFCVFENRQEATNVTHVWKRDGRVVSKVELEVGKSPKWRTWSRQRLKPTWTGLWTCEVQTMSGRILGTASARTGR